MGHCVPFVHGAEIVLVGVKNHGRGGTSGRCGLGFGRVEFFGFGGLDWGGRRLFLWGFGGIDLRASSFASREACQQNGHGQCGDGKTHVWVLDVFYKTKVQVKRFGVQVWPH